MKLLAVCFLLFASCNVGYADSMNSADDQSHLPGVIPQITSNQSAAAVLTSGSHNYPVGKDVYLTFTITNHSKSAMKYQFNSAQKYDVVITDVNGAVVWTWSHNRIFGPVNTNDLIPSGGTSVFKIEWTQRDDNDHPVPPGVYTAAATFMPAARPTVSGNLLSNQNNDPVNIGMPIMDNVQTGAVKINNTTPPLNAKTTFVIVSNK